MKVWFGVDPGLTGAIAFHSDTEQLKIFDMPTETVRTKNRIDFFRIHNIFKQFVYQIECGYVEKVSGMAYTDKSGFMRGQSSAASFNFGFGYGLLLGAIFSLSITTYETPSNVWKPSMGLSSRKEDSLELVRKLFPMHKTYFTRKKDHGRAEASLLAHLARKKFG